MSAAGGAPRPDWLHRLQKSVSEVPPSWFSRFLPPDEGGRQSAVLILFGPHEDGGEDVVLTERSADLRSHAGQVAFPGGALDPGDAGPVSAALREAEEEVGLTADGVEVVAELPALYLPPSGFVVTPVVAWWERPHPLVVVDTGEVARVVRARLDDLADPERRFTVTHPSGYVGPAFDVEGLLVWGFTAGLLAKTLELAGLERPWDRSRRRPLPGRFLAGPGVGR